MEIYIHLAWFDITNGNWVGEWCGYVPKADINPKLIGDVRLSLINGWLQEIQSYITPYSSEWRMLNQLWNLDYWEYATPGSLVCLDVTKFNWPLGDHIWHKWDDEHRLLDWPDSSIHRFIELNSDMCVVACVSSHRPIRSNTLKIIDITGTPLEQYWGSIWGQFVKDELGFWKFKPDETTMASGIPLVLEHERQGLLEMAPIDLELISVKEKVYVI